MYYYTILRLLLAGFFLYVAWPYIPQATLQVEKWFWGAWLAFLLLVLGGNLATVLKLTSMPVMEQKASEEVNKRRERAR